METWGIIKDDEVLCHYGVKGMKWNKHLKAKAVELKYKIRRRLNPSEYKARASRAALEKAAVARKQTTGSTSSLYREYEPRADISNRAEKALKKARRSRSAAATAKNMADGQKRTESIIRKNRRSRLAAGAHAKTEAIRLMGQYSNATVWAHPRAGKAELAIHKK